MRFRLLEGDGAEEAADFLDREAVGFFDRWRMIVHYHSVYGEARTDTLDTFRRERTAG